ncbi:hypothetical protein [Domibacillus iocasae]|uniref:hypothetical protein n=1 Tax=Domibacillus iocasae TaxID=1714016 RepID=UPI00114D3B8A|nr:hypothetical protein [Domibacillus iocasae]
MAVGVYVGGRLVIKYVAKKSVKYAAKRYKEKLKTGKGHGNRSNYNPATLYKKVDEHGNLLKWEITKHKDPTKRYTKKQIGKGRVIALKRGPRKTILKMERRLVETRPGPHNRER